MEIIEYNKKLNLEWDEFVDRSKNGTVFHTRRFLQYHPPGKFKDASLIFKHKKSIMSVFPAAIVSDCEKRILKSHPGASYGGPVLADKVVLKVVIDVVDEIIEYARDMNIDYVEMRVPPRVFQKYPSEELDYVLAYKGFDVTAVELSSAAPLSFKTDSDIAKRFRSDTLRSTNKARKLGVSIGETNDWESYWPLLYKNLMERHKTTPTHSLNELKTLVKLLPDKIRLFAAYYDGKMIAGTVVFVCNSVACHTFYIAQDYNYQNIRPINLLFYELLHTLKEEGFYYLNFGISTEAGGTIINPGLFRFKEGFGGCGVVRRYYSRRIDKDEG